MKRPHNIIFTLALTIALAFFAGCSGREVEVEPVFPQLGGISVQAQESRTLSFHATHPWSMTSDKIWCTFETEARNLQNTAGVAGDAAVTIHIGGEGLDFETASLCHISLTMAGRTEVIAEIRRNPKDYEFMLMDASGSPVEVIEAGYSDYVSFTCIANFSFAAISWDSEVLDIDGSSIVGRSDETVTGRIKIRQDGVREKYAFGQDAGYEIVFSDEQGSVRFSYPVVYAGMDPEEMEVTEVPGPAGQTFGWQLSADGAVLTQRQLHGEEQIYVHPRTSYDFTVKCFNDDYVLIISSSDGDDSGWIHVSKDGVKVSISFDANEGSRGRTASVYALTSAMYRRLGGTMESALAAMNPGTDADAEALETAFRIENSCRALELYQDFRDMYADDGLLTPIALRSDLGMDKVSSEYFCDPFLEVARVYPHALMERYGVEAAYEMTFPTGSGLIILPMIEGFGLESYYPEDDSSEASAAQHGTAVARAEFHYGDRLLDSSEFEPFDGFSDGSISVYGRPVRGFSFNVSGPEGGLEAAIYAVFTLSSGDSVRSKLVIINPPAAK